MRTDEHLRHDLAAAQRAAGLRGREIASMEAVDRRRRQIAAVGLVVAVGLLVSTLFSSGVFDLRSRGWIDVTTARFASLGFAICMIMYTFDKERHLRRFVQEREQLYALDGEIAQNLLTSGLLLDVAVAVHSTLSLDELLPILVDQGRSLIGTDQGVLFIEEEGRPMEPAVDPANLAAIGAPIAGLAAARGGVVGIVEDGTVDIGVPMVSGTQVLAVLVLPGVVASQLTESTRALLDRFGRIAGSALANARRYEAAIFLFDVA